MTAAQFSYSEFAAVRSFIQAFKPDYVQKTLHTADMALQGKQILSGTRGEWLFVGNPPDWQDNKVNNNGYVWMLNRMNHWLTLAEAYLFTHERKYIDQVLTEMMDWIESCPPPEFTTIPETARRVYTSVDPWRQLEVGERMGNVWPFVLKVMEAVPGLLDDARPAILKSLYEHGRILREVCPLLWPGANHNYYLTEMWGLFALALNFPELEEAEEWAQFAKQELERCMSAQFSEDGGQVEGCPSYHNFTTVHMGKVGLLAKKHGIVMSDAFIAKYGRTLDYTVQTCRPTGQIVPWGDSSADYHAAMTLTLGALYSGDRERVRLLQSWMGAERFRDNALPLLFEFPEAVELLQALDAGDDKGTAGAAASGIANGTLPRAFRDRQMDQAAMRSDWSREALSVFFVCRSPVYNGHSHIDPAGFDFTAWGRPLIVDPGRYNYWWMEERRKFKSAAWHNTLTVNERDPYEYISSWEYGTQKPGRLEALIDHGDWIRASAVHYNYEPVVHKRDLVLFPDRFLLVLDEVSGLSSGDTVQLNWHFDALEGIWDDNRQLAYTDRDEVNVAVWTGGERMTGIWHEASISDKMDHLRPSKRLAMNDAGGAAGVRRYATAIIPVKEKLDPDQLQSIEVGPSSAEPHTEIVCRLQFQGGRYEVPFTRPGF